MSETAIRVENLSKRYRIGLKEELHDTFVGALTSWAKYPLSNLRRLQNLSRFSDNGGSEDIIWALRDISFEVKRGEVLGIIGKNGAGKSTLLKILCRITEPTSGAASIYGRVASLLEVGTGFHPELTGRENIYLNGTILGMKKAEIAKKFDEIVNFSGVEKFIDTPVKRYSSGMRVRLAFSVAAHLEPEILLVDEVLAVGDVAFQRKCLRKMGEIAGGGRTVLFVSHNMAAMDELCDRTVMLNNGRIDIIGKPHEVISYYLNMTFKLATTSLSERKDRSGTGDIRLTDFWVETPEGKRISVLRSGNDYILVAQFRCQTKIPLINVTAAFGILNQHGVYLFRPFTGDTGEDFSEVHSDGEFRCFINHIPLPSGRYQVNCRITANEEELEFIKAVGIFDVEKGNFFRSGKQSDHAPVLLDHSWSLQTYV